MTAPFIRDLQLQSLRGRVMYKAALCYFGLIPRRN